MLNHEELNQLREVGFVTKKAEDPIEDGGEYLGVRVKVDNGSVPPEELKDLRFEHSNGREGFLQIFNFKLDGTAVTFWVVAKVSDSWTRVYGNAPLLGRVVTTFPDFCWKLAEGTTPQSKLEVSTPVDDKDLGDLTAVLPYKFCEDFLESMEVLNTAILAGLMRDAVLTGPVMFILDGKETEK